MARASDLFIGESVALGASEPFWKSGQCEGPSWVVILTEVLQSSLH
jgi:hypothetical protein